MEHRVGVPLEEEDNGAAVDEDAGGHEDEDGDVSGGPCEGQALHHGLHPRPRRAHVERRNFELINCFECLNQNCVIKRFNECVF